MTATLKTITRQRRGTRPSRVLRLQGRIPVSLQGENAEHLDLAIDEHEFLAARRHHEHVFTLQFEDGGQDTAMVRELQWDPMGEHILHVEFRRVDLARETEAEVSLEFVGHPKGGVLNHLLTHLEVAAIPALIPDLIEVKVDAMEMGHPLLARDIVLPEGVRLVTPGETSVAVVVTVHEEQAAPAEEAATEAAPEAGAPGAAPAAGAAAKAAPPKGPATKG